MAITYDPQSNQSSGNAVRGIAQQQRARDYYSHQGMDNASIIQALMGHHQQQQYKQTQFQQPTIQLPSPSSLKQKLQQQHQQHLRPQDAKATFSKSHDDPMSSILDQLKGRSSGGGYEGGYDQSQQPQTQTGTEDQKSWLQSALTDTQKPSAPISQPVPESPNIPNIPTSSGVSGANYMKGPLPSQEDLVRVETASGPMVVNKAAANDMRGFVNDLVAAGAPVNELGSYNNRKIANSDLWSQHAYGTALDWGQSARNVVTPEFKSWADANPEVLNSILKNRNMVSGGNWRNPDFGHFEWSGPNVGGSNPAVRGSWFNDTRTASGQNASSVPGIALPSGGKMGDMYRVTTPDGRVFNAPLIDRGPAGWTGRGVDISQPLASQMYPNLNQFPTDAQFTVEPY